MKDTFFCFFIFWLSFTSFFPFEKKRQTQWICLLIHQGFVFRLYCFTTMILGLEENPKFVLNQLVLTVHRWPKLESLREKCKQLCILFCLLLNSFAYNMQKYKSSTTKHMRTKLGWSDLDPCRCSGCNQLVKWFVSNHLHIYTCIMVRHFQIYLHSA